MGSSHATTLDATMATGTPEDLVATTRTLVERAPEPATALSACRHELEEASFRCTTLDDGADGVLWARRGRRPTIALAGHVDVVPVGDPDAWTRDPRGGVLDDGRVYGRGTSDMLGAVACFLTLAEARPDLDLAVALTTDEETGMDGARLLAESGLLDHLDALVLGEPTDLALGLAHKGGHWSTITTRGRNAHASMPEEGENALEHMGTVLERLRNLELGGSHPLLTPATVVPTVMEAGNADTWNQVPARAQLKVDARFPPPLTADQVTHALQEALDDLPANVDVSLEFPPFQADPGDRLVEVTTEALTAQGRTLQHVGFPYGTEASRYQREDLDIVVIGPGEAELAHTPNESVPLRNLEDGLAAYTRIVEAYQPGEASG